MNVSSITKASDPNWRAYFQFGRYLVIASSPPGSQPATFGKCRTDQLKPPWDAKLHVHNSNTETEYWPAKPETTCHECAESRLFALIDDCGHNLAATLARLMYAHAGLGSSSEYRSWRGTAPIKPATTAPGSPAAPVVPPSLGSIYHVPPSIKPSCKAAYPL